jgi:hypothetical protein
VNTFCNLIMTFVVGQTFLSMLCAMKFGVSSSQRPVAGFNTKLALLLCACAVFRQ